MLILLAFNFPRAVPYTFIITFLFSEIKQYQVRGVSEIPLEFLNYFMLEIINALGLNGKNYF